MPSIAESLANAVAHHQAGRLADAEVIYRAVVDVQPDHPAAVHLLGAVCFQQNRPQEAVPLLERAVELNPGSSDVLNHLGGAYHGAGLTERAFETLAKCVDLTPDNAKFQYDLGNAHKGFDRPHDAIRCFRKAVELRPDFIQAWHNLGTTLTAADDAEAAIAAFEAALAVKPDYANAHRGLGNALHRIGRSDQAVRWLRSAIAFRPDDASYRSNLGVALKALGEWQEACECFQRAIDLQPDFFEAHQNLGNLFVTRQQLDRAVGSFRTAAAIRPDDAEIHLALGDALRDGEQLKDATDCYRRAFHLRPDHVWWQLREMFLCPSVFESMEAVDDYRRSLLDRVNEFAGHGLRLHPAGVERCGCMPPFGLPYHGRNDRPLKEAVAALYRDSFAAEPRETSRDRPRIGLVITGGHEGIFLRCMQGLVDRLDRDRFEICLVCPESVLKSMRESFEVGSVEYVILPTRFDRMVETVRAAGLDVAYFWECGTDVLNYFLPFVRVAPIQCTGWGFPVTSGNPEMDYYLSSDLVEPPDADEHYSERLIRATTLLNWQQRIPPPRTVPSHAELGFSDSTNVYLCAQNLRKFHPDFDPVLANVLSTDPQGVVLCIADETGRIASTLQQRFQRSIPDVADRIVFRRRQSFDDYLQLVAAADVVLDPLHFGSGITAYEILSCGTPIVTLPGIFRRGRFVAGLYEKMHLSDCVARSTDDYVAIACRLAADPDFRRSMKGAIQERREIVFEDASAVSEFGMILDRLVTTGPPDDVAGS